MDTPEKESHWVPCPICHGKTRIKVYEDTFLLHFPLYCPKCKQETEIGVAKGNVVVMTEKPDA